MPNSLKITLQRIHTMKNIIRGERLKLSDLTSSQLLQVGISINAPSGMLIDISCFGVDEYNQLSDDSYFIFYNQKTSPCGSLCSLGAKDSDQERFQVDLAKLPKKIRRLVFVATIDGNGTMSQITSGYLRLIVNNAEVGRFNFTGSDFSTEKAIMVSEIYFKDLWRFTAVGQGFAGGLSELLKHFGGVEISEPAPVIPPPPPVDLKLESKKISLTKRIEKDAPHLINLAKTLTVSLEKKNLLDTVAKVALVLDASGSMYGQYSNGAVQLVVDRIVPLAVHFDDDGDLETWTFANKSKNLTSVTLKNVKNYVSREWGGWEKWMANLEAGYNNEPVVMREIVKTYKKSKLPAYVIFISDGGVGYDYEIEKILVEASKYPIFWQFVGLGGSNYGILERFDTMKGRFIDNCNFFALDDIRNISDEKLYERLLNEFPDWLKSARDKRLIS